MKMFLAFTAAILILSACEVPKIIVLDTNRAAAKAVVGPIVAKTIPGPAAIVLTECIIENASSLELNTLSEQGASLQNINLVSNILARPETVTCAQSALT
ncbi:MAG: hypothetical protein ACI9RO_000368 [Alteromonas macleodii]|jgi:hypothetical protein|tara:strand:+ start:167 stop:466 length:300 start_codon:yes stop_codon:yes gene_type:complete